MKSFLRVGLFGVTLAMAAPAVAEMSYAEWEKISDQDAARIYLKGIVTGLEWANSAIEQRGAIFCQPRDLASTIEQSEAIIGSYMVGASEEARAYPLGMVMMQAMIARFPC